MQLAVASGALLSVLWALRLANLSVNRAYYGTDARAYQLLAGALLALSPGILRRASRYRGMQLVALAAFVSLLVFSTSLIVTSPIRRGIATAIITVVLIAAIESVRSGPVSRVLSWGPAVYLGQISYGTYLWHWPVILVARHELTGISPVSTFAIAAFVATSFASLSYRLLEQPIRQGRFLDSLSPAVIATGLCIGLVSALLVVPHVLAPKQSQIRAVANLGAVGTPIPPLDFLHAQTALAPDLAEMHFFWNCEGKPSSVCTIVKGGGPHILVIGDSQAHMFFPTFARLALQQNLTLSTAAAGGCPWERDLYDPRAIPTDPHLLEHCMSMKKDLYNRVIPQLKPDLIVVISRDNLNKPYPGKVFDAAGRPIPTTNTAQLLRLETADTVRSLKELGRWTKRVLIVEPVPADTPSDDPLACLQKSKVIEACRFVADAQPTQLERMFRSVADGTRVFDANLDALVCPFLPVCDPILGGQIVRWDPAHITPRFAETLSGSVQAILARDGLIPP